MKIVQISACVDRGDHFLYALLEDGRVYRRQRVSMFSKNWDKKWGWIEIIGREHPFPFVNVESIGGPHDQQ